MSSVPLLWIVTLLPAVGALSLVFVPDDEASADAPRGAALVWSLLAFVASLPLYFFFDANASGYQFTHDHAWLPAIGASLKVGVDGIAMLLIMLTTFLVPLTVIASWRSIETRVKEFHIALLMLESFMIGVFAARDLLLFYLFWEAMLIPMFLMIGIWGGPARVRAAVKFFVYTAVGSLLMLAAILYVYWAAGSTFDLDKIDVALAGLRKAGTLDGSKQTWLFLGFALAFAIKVPLFPFHTWLPHAHVEAPTAGSVILAAVMLKMGGYGLLRFALPLFPSGAIVVAPWALTLAAIGVVYGSLMALAQDDVKRLIAYSSVSHLALVVLGTFAFTPRAIAGGVFQMLSHGLSTGALFLAFGALYERRHTRKIAELGGIARPAPALATAFVIATLASIALPGTSGFVGEFLVIFGVYEGHHPWLAATAASGAILGAAYMLLVVKRVFFGEATGENEHVRDLNGRELTYLVPVLGMSILLGVCPTPFLSKLERAVQPIASAFGQG
jgi:NADH-quinone oxidoreductase subunit M